MGWLTAGLRRWRDDAIVSVVVAFLVLASALVLGLAPRLLARVGDDALRASVTALPQAGRAIQLLHVDRIGYGSPDPLGPVVAAGSDLEAQLPASVRALVVARSLVVDAPRFEVEASGSRTASLLTLRIQPGALDHVSFTAGRPPGVGSRRLLDAGAFSFREVYEVALSVETAARMGVRVGDTLRLGPDLRDPLALRLRIPAAAEVTGLFEVADSADPFWFGDSSMAVPAIRAYSSEAQYVDAIGLLSPDAYPRLFDATSDPYLFRVEWRFDVDPARVTARDVDGLLADLRRMATLFPPTTVSAPVEVRTDLTRVVGGHVDRWRSAALILAVAGIGTAAVGLAALALVALLAARRRGQTLALWTARGASRAQLLGAGILEASIVTAPPALAAFVLAVAVIPDVGAPLATGALCALVAIAAGSLLVAAEAVAAPGRAGEGSMAGRPAGLRSRRAAIEAAVVIAAITGAYLLRQRAAPSGAPAALGSVGPTGPDPFIAAVPALVGLAAGILAARLFRLPMRVLGAVAVRGRGLVPVLGFRRSTRGGTAAAMLLVLMATTTIATFGAATLAHLDQAAAAIAWHDVGADLHVSASTPTFPQRVDLASVPGVGAVAEVSRATVPLGLHGATVLLLAVDPAELTAVTGGTPADTGVSDDLSGAGQEPLPAVVSPALSDSAELGADGTLDLSVDGDHVRIRGVRTVEAFPTIALDQGSFAVVSRPALEAALRRRLSTTDALVRAPGMTASAFEHAIAGQMPAANVAGRAETESATRHSPIVDAAAIGIVLAALIAAWYAATALIAALALASAARATEAAHLRTLGLSRRQSIGLVMIEHVPAVALAFLAGTGLGVLTFALVEPGLGLGGLLGSALSVPLAVEPVQLLALLAVTAVVTGASIAVGAALERSAAMAASVRRGIG